MVLEGKERLNVFRELYSEYELIYLCNHLKIEKHNDLFKNYYSCECEFGYNNEYENSSLRSKLLRANYRCGHSCYIIRKKANKNI